MTETVRNALAKDKITVFQRDARFVYAGNNPRMLALVVRCVAELGFTKPLHYVADLLTAADAPAIAKPITSANLPPGCSLEEFLLTNFDVPLFDLGLDQTGLNLGRVDRVTDWPRDLRYSLGAVARLARRAHGVAVAIWSGGRGACRRARTAARHARDRRRETPPRRRRPSRGGAGAGAVV